MNTYMKMRTELYASYFVIVYCRVPNNEAFVIYLEKKEILLWVWRGVGVGVGDILLLCTNTFYSVLPRPVPMKMVGGGEIFDHAGHKFWIINARRMPNELCMYVCM